MKVKFQMPELLVVCSAVLFCFNYTVVGWVFFGVGMLGSFSSYALEVQEKQQLAKKVEDGLGELKDAGSAFSDLVDAFNSAGKKTRKTNKNFH